MRRTSLIGTAVAIIVGAALTATALPSASAQSHPNQDAAPARPDHSIAAADAAVSSSAWAASLHKGAGDTLVRKAVHQGSETLRYVSYERTYRGLPVVGGDAVVVTDTAGTVRGTAAAQSATISVGTTAKVTAAKAASVARAKLHTVESATAPRLVVLAWGTPRLAYETVLTGADAKGAPSKLHVFVDARTAKVTESYDEVRDGTGNGDFYPGVQISTTNLGGGQFSMADPTRPGIRCGGQNGATFTGTDDVWGNGSGTNLETACVDALYGVQKEWDMLAAWLGRNGINGSGGGFPARVGLNQVNAFWNGSFTSFGHNQANTHQATSIDVVAHEFGHAIFQTTPGGAGSGNENGGINEGNSDIFGALTEHFANHPNDPPDYQVGEEVDLVGDGPIRFMYNPSLAGDPNCWTNAIPGTEVHAAAGPLNHAFYLMAEGSNPGGGKPSSPTCNGSTVTGLGIQTAARIHYNALLMKTSTWRYTDVRFASLQAAKNLFPGSCTEFNVVKAAYDAVTVPARAGEPTCNTQGNDFSIAVSPSSATVTAGGAATTSVNTAVTSGSAQTVNLSASGLPAGATATFTPASVTAGGSSSLRVATSASTPNGTFSITVTGTGTSATHTATFTLTVGGGGGGCSGTTNTPVNIPDAPGAAVNSPITISGCNRAPSSTSTVAVNITHTWRGDLVIDLVAPDGTAFRLKNSNINDSADNVIQTFTANLSGESANGTWNLRVQDVFRADTGRINTWTLNL